MDGILIIDKPAGLTSHDVVNRVRRVLGTKRVGHTGTLDPFATGVMAVLVGRATRLAQFVDKDEKEYEAVVRFGFETDTGDRTGVQSAAGSRQLAVSDAELRDLLDKFRGKIEQVPPMYSAKKIGGKKLYEYARKGESIEREPQTVTISLLELIDPVLDLPVSTLRIRVACSAGTYIRVLAEDIGRAVGTGAHLDELRRTRSGRFDISSAISIDALDEMENPSHVLLPMETAVESLTRVVLTDERVSKTRSGMSTRLSDASFADGETIAFFSESGELIAVGNFDAAEMSVKPKVVLV